VSLVYLAQSGSGEVALSPGLTAIATSIGANSLAHLLAKFDEKKGPSIEEIKTVVEQALTDSRISECMTKTEYEEEIATVIYRLDILGAAMSTALGVHHTALARTIRNGMEYYQKIWREEASRQFDLLLAALENADPERISKWAY
jgi:hypothetical protein